MVIKVDTTTYSFLVSGLAGLSTLIGCIFLFVKNKDKRILIGSLGFASGVMLSVSLTDLVFSCCNPIIMFFHR